MNRRDFHRTLSAAAFFPLRGAAPPQAGGPAGRPAAGGSLTDVSGVKVGHFTHTDRPTGCTVVLVEQGAVAGVDVRGAAPGTRETDLLDPVNTVEKIHAVLLAGGSAFGLDAAGGVVQYLEERGIGFETLAGRVPIVPAAILFDLGVGDGRIRPDRAAGYSACRNAAASPPREGNVGAGAGATVGKMFGPGRAMKGGLGTASITVGDLVVAALVAVNSVGDVYDWRNGRIVAGARTEDGTRLVNTISALKQAPPAAGAAPPVAGGGESTAIGVVATNMLFDKAAMARIARMAHDGLARSINPVHTPSDGDTLFALSTGTVARPSPSSAGLVGALAAEAVSEAVLRAVLAAQGIPGFPAARDLGDLDASR